MLRDSQTTALTNKMKSAEGVAWLSLISFVMSLSATSHFYLNGGYFGGEQIDVNQFGFVCAVIAFVSLIVTIAFCVRATCLSQRLKNA